ncbi:acyl-CoA dehydrogenase family protein [Brevundimonas sp.]|uniref:acyl-CoA dehydrogenase family protein n=1 Tax=Brevundimonas sp. TaxID=1871086 RepID=UPI0025D2D5BC|nr:acyl-CoA dehydrogenase family protein [Brevundimonas sp.]
MPLILTEEQTMLEEAARGFLAEAAPIAHLRALRDSRDPDGVSRDLWTSFGEMGFAGVLVPEAHGGSGLGAVEAGVIAEAVGRNLVPSPFLSTGVLAATALQAGSEEQQRWLPEIAAGRLIAAVALDEGCKHRPDQIETTATRSGNGWRLDGAKAMVLDGHVADLLIVAARTDEGVGLFTVAPGAEGVEVERTLMVDAHNAARVTLSGVKVQADALIGAADGGLFRAVCAYGGAMVAAEMTGAAEAAYEQTLAYLRERKQFGRAIGEFQALQHRAAHLYAELEITKAAVLKALQLLDSDPEAAGPAVSVAKARAGKSSELAVQEAVQMHGGVGMTDEFDVGLFMKRIRVCQELFGDTHHHAERLARLSGY